MHMKTWLLLTGLLAAAVLPAEDTYRGKPGSKLTIDGDSNVHKWKVESIAVGGIFKLTAADLAKTGPVNAKAKVTVITRSLKSNNKRMDEVMHAALNADTHKTIEFDLDHLEVTKSEDKGASCRCRGTVKINGKTKAITLAAMILESGDKLTVKGATELKMTDFGIKPPAPQLPTGSVTTKDEVKITFEWVVQK